MRVKIWYLRRPGFKWTVKRLFLYSPWEDVAIEVSGQVYSIDKLQGVVSHTFKEFDEKYRQKTWSAINVSDPKSIVNYLNEQLGAPVDGSIMMPLFRKKSWSDDQAWYSSELVTSALVRSKVIFCPKLRRVTPRTLWSLVPTVIVTQDV